MSGLIVLQGCATVQLTQGKNALIDAQDFGLFGFRRWYAVRVHGIFYAYRDEWPCGKRKTFLMHRVIMDAPAGMMVDHRNGDGLDCRRENLRLCTDRQNKQNIRKSHGTSRFKGVSLEKRSRMWVARISIPHGPYKYLGRFATEEEAASAYDEAARKYHGEFAATNAEIFGMESSRN